MVSREIKTTDRADRRAPDMKQRFSISRDIGGEKIVIREYAELDKSIYSLLCAESYPAAEIEAALAKGADRVIALLRTDSFFPTSYFAKKLIGSLGDYFQSGSSEEVLIDADDTECISSVSRHIPMEGPDSIEDLLDVAGEEIIEDDDEPVGKLDAPIKIAEDETVEISNSL
jgi:hypothetical protein